MSRCKQYDPIESLHIPPIWRVLSVGDAYELMAGNVSHPFPIHESITTQCIWASCRPNCSYQSCEC